MSALMTPWVIDPTLHSAAGTTAVTQYDMVLAGLTSLEAIVASHWSICSNTSASNPRYITLKRKDARAGRILFFWPTASISPVNTTLQKANLVNSLIDTFNLLYFPNATTDTPGAFTGSAVLFTAGALNTGIGFSTLIGVTSAFRFASSPEGIIVCGNQSQDAGGGRHLWVAGDLVDAANGTAIPCGGRIAIGGTVHPSAAAAGIANLNAVDTTDTDRFVPLAVSVLPTTPSGNMRAVLLNVVTKEVYFMPYVLSSVESPFAKWNSFKLRQIGIGPTAVAVGESFATTGPVTAAQDAAPVINNLYQPWLLNFLI